MRHILILEQSDLISKAKLTWEDLDNKPIKVSDFNYKVRMSFINAHLVLFNMDNTEYLVLKGRRTKVGIHLDLYKIGEAIKNETEY